MGKKVREGYKKTDFGEIPIEWKVKKFRDIFERIVEKNKNNISENVLTISAQNGLINQEKFFNKSVASKNTSNYFLMKKGDFAYNKSYSVGYPMGAIKRLNSYNKGIVSPLYICFRIKDENINSDFYEQFFEYDLFDKAISGIAQEGARNHGLLNVAVNEFFDLPIIVPTKKEQEKIAEILSTVDEQIENIEKLIQKNQELKRGLMQQLLTKGIGHTEFKETELGYIPKCWDIKRLGECADIVSGATPKTNIKEYWDNGNIHWATPTDITSSGKYINKTEKFITDSGLKNCSAKILPIGSILMSSRATIGERSLNTVPMATNQGFKSLICKSIVDNEFIYYYIEVLKERFIRLASGSTFLEISKKLVEDTKIIVPNLEEQKKIASILALIDEKIYRYENKKEKLEELKNGLMQSLMTGKIRVI